jgi:hypothetical protein
VIQTPRVPGQPEPNHRADSGSNISSAMMAATIAIFFFIFFLQPTRRKKYLRAAGEAKENEFSGMF